MIEGLWIEMSSEKLRGLFSARITHHRAKATWYKQQADQIEAGAVDMQPSNNPVHSLRNSQREHEAKTAFFGVLADNIIPNETYRLSEQNCMRIELYAQYF